MVSRKLVVKILCVLITLSIVLIASTNVTSAALSSRPLILSFRVSDTEISQGETVNLSWFVVNAVDVQIIGLEKTPEGINILRDSIEVWPMATTTYLLVATSADGLVTSRTVTVNVDEGTAEKKPKISYFWSFKKVIESGETARLWWNTTNTEKIEIIGLEKEPESELPLTGSLEVWPMKTTTYILNAYGENGIVVSKSITINVLGTESEPEIVYFNADATDIILGDTVKLSWKVNKATEIDIIGLEKEPEGELPLEGELEVWPMATTNYILTARNEDGVSVSSSVIVNVSELPEKTIPVIIEPTPEITTLPEKTLPIIVDEEKVME